MDGAKDGPVKKCFFETAGRRLLQLPGVAILDYTDTDNLFHLTMATSYKSKSSSSIVDEVTEMYSKLSADVSADELENLICSPNVEAYAQMYDSVRQKFESQTPDSPQTGTRKRPSARPTKGGSFGALTQGQSTSGSTSSASSRSMEAYEMDLLNGNKVVAQWPDDEKSPDERTIEVFKQNNQPLGMTVKEENGRIEVARILVGSIIEKQDQLHVGDVILAVDGQEVKSPQAFIAAVKRSSGKVTFRIIPSFVTPPPKTQCYLRALFSYDPLNDTLIPCKELGLSFITGEVLEILNREDPNWWQARRMSEPDLPVGLVPSQELEEMRRAFVDPELDYSTKITICGTKASKKKKKQMYQSDLYAEFERAELQLYEEVCRMPPFERKTLVLIGAKGVGRRTLKARLIAYDPDRYAAPIPHTSRPIKECEMDGKQYHFVKRDIMEKDVANGKYLECGEFEGHLFGTKLDSIRAIIRSGKMCIIDCNPQVKKDLCLELTLLCSSNHFHLD